MTAQRPNDHAGSRSSNKRLLNGALMITMVGALTWAGCRKEADPSPALPADAAAVNFTPRIKHFLATIQGPAEAKSGTTYSVDSAAWYVEGALNMELTQAWIACENTATGTLNVAVPATGGVVAANDAATAYNTLQGQLAELPQEGESHLVVIDIQPAQTDEGLVFKATYALGSGYGKLWELNTEFDEDDFLCWGVYEPACACTGGNPSALCADGRIQSRVKGTIPPLAMNQYYASVESWYIELGTDTANHYYAATHFVNTTNSTGRSNQDYKTYICWDSNCSSCLDDIDLSYHTQGTYDVMHWVRTQHCPNKVAANVAINGDLYGSGTFVHLITYT
jgi:hypothetical protein